MPDSLSNISHSHEVLTLLYPRLLRALKMQMTLVLSLPLSLFLWLSVSLFLSPSSSSSPPTVLPFSVVNPPEEGLERVNPGDPKSKEAEVIDDDVEKSEGDGNENGEACCSLTSSSDIL